MAQYGKNDFDSEHPEDGQGGSMRGARTETCSFCKKILLKVNMERHKNWHKELPFECKRGCSVNVRFPTRLEQRDHYRAVHGKHKCDICDYSFHFIADLRTHNHYAHGADKFQCSDCKLILTTSERLKAHIKNIHPGRINCPICNKLFRSSRKREFNNHLKSHGKTSVNEKVRQIEKMVKREPEAEFEQFPDNLQQSFAHHAIEEDKKPEKVHTIVKELKCEQCNQKLLESNMEAHLNWHAGLRPYKCQLGCKGDGFRSNQMRLDHYHKVHAKTTCKICDKTFQNALSLSTHMNMVHKANDFTCCGKQFATKTDMERHRYQEHNPERRYGCPVCHVNFAKSKFAAHLATHGLDASSDEFDDQYEIQEVKIVRDDGLEDMFVVSVKKEL